MNSFAPWYPKRFKLKNNSSFTSFNNLLISSLGLQNVSVAVWLKFLVTSSSDSPKISRTLHLSRGTKEPLPPTVAFFPFPSDFPQVCSPTQFKSAAGFLRSVWKSVIYKHTIKICISCFGHCPGTCMPSLTHLTGVLFISEGLELAQKTRFKALERSCVTSKKPCPRTRQGRFLEDL